jgi:hypothetical protein
MNRHIVSFGILVLVFGVLAAFVWTTPANADNLYASIRGTVTDSSGAVVPGAKITATNVATGNSFPITSSKDGSFSFLQLPIGDYKVKAEVTGFKTFQATGIHLDLNDVRLLNILLEVGTVSQTVIVESNPVQVESSSMQLGTTITGNEIVDQPLNGRNWTALQLLQPGIVGTTDRFGGAYGAYSGNGAGTQQNSFLINGTDTNDISLNIASIVPSPDAIEEFRMVTNTLNPEYGRNSGTIINAAIKNGTNQFHGNTFEFYRDTFLDAKSWFELEPSPFHQNQFGGTLGGPIDKNHAFFFFSYQGLRATEPLVHPTPTVFSSAERGGDFSAASGGPGPFTSGNVSPIPMVGTNGTMYPAGTPYSTLFPTGVIPAADLNPLAVKLMNQFVPLPNSTGNTYLFNPSEAITNDQYLYRVDDKLREQDSIWFYGLYETSPNTQGLPFTGATLPGFSENNKQHYQEYTVAWNHTFSSTALNEVRFAYLRFNLLAVNPVNPIDPTTYGFAGITPQNAALASLPVMTVNGLFTLGFSQNGPQPRVQNTYQATDNFSKVWGHHTFKAGFNMERLEVNNPFYNNLGGDYTYGGGGPFSTGNTGADFLLGIPDSYAQGSGSIVLARGREYYSYGQDQWQVKKNLTLTLGVGWDIETPWKNLFANGEIMGAWRPGQQSTKYPSMPVGFVYPGDAGINQYGGPTIHHGDFAPRLGFAWSPGSAGNWSVRGGIGLYYNRSEEELALETLTNAPFALTTTGATTITSPTFASPFTTVNPTNVTNVKGTVLTAGTIPNPFPFIPPALGTAFNPATFAPIGFSFNAEDPHLTSPRATNFNLTIQRQISKSTIASVGYVGSIGRHEEGAYVGNLAGLPNGTNPVAAAAGCTTGLSLTSAPCPQTPLGAPQVPGATPYNLALYGHPGIQATEFNSNYNSLQAELNRRFSNGLEVLAAYTYSRNFDQTSSLENGAFTFPGLNPFNFASMYGPSVNDAPQRFVVSYTYTLPLYKLGHHWKRLTDDWNLVGSYTLQHGTPIAVFDFLSTSLTCDNFVAFYTCPDRADRSSTPITYVNPRSTVASPANGTGNFWFTNGAAEFPIPSPGTGIGNANRNPLYGPGTNYSDMALEKSVHIDETRYIQFRLETFNTFNHANFQNPNTPGFGGPCACGVEDASPIDAATFGQIFAVKTLSTNGDGRVVQLAAKFYF